MRAFISHSSRDARFAGRVAKTLETGHVDVWLDKTNTQLGELLRHQLQSAIEKSRAVVLLWSRPAAASRWVCAEVLTAFHTGRFIVPCVLDKTRLPLFLSKSLSLDCSRPSPKTLKDLVRHVRDAPRRANDFPPPMIAREPKLREVMANVAMAQKRELEALVKRDLDAAAGVHAKVHDVMRQAEKLWRNDPAILNLGGFHRKNAYMLEHWDAVQAFQPRKDPRLRRAERLFFRSLFLDPNDCSALDGIASVLMLEGDTAAARFFDQRAIDLAAARGIDYIEAKANLALIDRFDRRAKVSAASVRKPAPRRIGKSDAQAHLEKGLEAFGVHRYAEALMAFDRALEIEPNSCRRPPVARECTALSRPREGRLAGDRSCAATGFRQPGREVRSRRHAHRFRALRGGTEGSRRRTRRAPG